jgi:hypothetical protein
LRNPYRFVSGILHATPSVEPTQKSPEAQRQASHHEHDSGSRCYPRDGLAGQAIKLSRVYKPHHASAGEDLLESLIGRFIPF